MVDVDAPSQSEFDELKRKLERLLIFLDIEEVPCLNAHGQRHRHYSDYGCEKCYGSGYYFQRLDDNGQA